MKTKGTQPRHELLKEYGLGNLIVELDGKSSSQSLICLASGGSVHPQSIQGRQHHQFHYLHLCDAYIWIIISYII